jgi:hypothetical protein
MNVTCPSRSVKNLDEAVLAFQGRSFLTSYTRRNPDGVLSKNFFLTLLDNAYKTGDYIKYNAYSFYQLASNVNREYCYYLERFVFYEKLYIHTRQPEYKTTADIMEQKAKDLLTCIDYLEDLQINGDDSYMVNPTRDMPPLSSNQRIDLREAMADIKDPALRTDMLEYSLEKNRSAQSLLAVYGFLNLTAVAVLIYIYRAK